MPLDISVGAAPNDGTGTNRRTAWQRTKAVVDSLQSLQSQIISAGDIRFAGYATTEAKISAARVQVAVELGTTVVIPAVMFGFDPTLVDFTNTAVRNVREGGDYTKYDAVAYGAYFDDAHDDTQSWLATIAAAGANQGTITGPPGTTRVTRLLVQQSNIQFWLPNVTFHRTVAGVFAQGMLDIRGSVGAGDVLASTAVLGAGAITVTAGSTFTTGDYIEIDSDAFITDASIHPYLYELNQITNIAGNVLTLRLRTRNRYDTGVATVHVRQITPLTGIDIQGGRFIGPGGTVGDCLRLNYCLRPSVTDIEASNFGDRGLSVVRCQAGVVSQCEAHDGTDATNSWGISLESAEGMELLACKVYNTPWDGIDLSLGAMYNHLTDCRVTAAGDVGFIVGHGVHGHHNVLTNCVAVATGAAGFACGNSTYEGDDDNVFIGCRAVGCQNHSFTLRQNSSRNRYIGCHAVSGTGSGFNVIGSSVVDTELLACHSTGNTNFGFNNSGTRTALLYNQAAGNTSGNVSDSGTNTVRRGNRFGTGLTGPMAGRAVLVGGTVTVSTDEVAASDNMTLTRVLAGGSLGHLSISTIIPGTSFVINSDSGADTSTIFWELVH